MKRILLLAVAAVLTVVGASAQSQFLSAERQESADRPAQLGGQRGVLVLSSYNDLVLTVTNAEATITPHGMGTSGYYEYEIVTSHNNPKIKFNRRGNIITGEKAIIPRKDYMTAFLIVEPKTAIQLIPQGDGASLSREYAEVEINSNIPNLKVEYSKHLQATANVRQQEHDKSITTTTLRIPLKVFKETKEKAERLRAEFEALENKTTKLGDDLMGTATEEEWNRLDALQKETEEAEQIWAEVNAISVYVPGESNVEQIGGLAEELKPETKKIYGVRLLNNIEVVHKTKYSGFMEEGGRLYSQRDYANARQAYINALNADDTPENMRQAIQTSIDQCDHCTEYEDYTLRTFDRIGKLKKNGGTQAEVAEAVAAGIEYLKELDRYNPNSFYTSRIDALKKIVDKMPLEIRFTTVRWMHDDVHFFEAGKLPNVQIWSYRGSQAPSAGDYRTEKRFREVVSRSNLYELVGTTNSEGVVEIQVNRGDPPTGFILRATGSGSDKVKPSYRDFKELVQNAEGTYNKLVFRERMFTAN